MSAEFVSIRNCGSAAREAPLVRFKFKCPRTWEGLDPGPDADSRHCGTCARLVYLCRTPDEAAARALSGDCIAVRSEMAERDGPGWDWATVVGEPSPKLRWVDDNA